MGEGGYREREIELSLTRPVCSRICWSHAVSSSQRVSDTTASSSPERDGEREREEGRRNGGGGGCTRWERGDWRRERKRGREKSWGGGGGRERREKERDLKTLKFNTQR